MNQYSYVVGNRTNRGPEALLLSGNAIIGTVSLAYAGAICERMNRKEGPLDAEALSEMHEIVVEMYRMTAQMIETRERDGFTGKVSDDAKRALWLLDRAGRLTGGEL